MVSIEKTAVSHDQIAAAWLARLASSSAAAMPLEENLPQHALLVLAAFTALALAEGRTVVILVPDDEPLPEVSNALDLALRPLCLVLPGADFAARIALRATLSLMKSRLSRDGEDEQSPAWQRQRERIEANQPLWNEVQTWMARNDRSEWPNEVAELFPARILPITAYRLLKQKSSDITLLFRCDAPPELVARPGSVLQIGTRAQGPRHRSLVAADETVRLKMELAQLTQEVAELELELATAQGEVAEFTHRYYEQVGRRMVELDSLQAQLAEQQADAAPEDELRRSQSRTRREQAEKSAHESRRFAEAAADNGESSDAGTPFRPSVDMKRLFRQIAQKIHPDRAADETERTWRTQLMSEANRAYRAGDEHALKEVIALWEEGRPDQDKAGAATTNGISTASSSPLISRLNVQIERLRARLSEIEGELHRLFGSRLYELFIAVRQAWRQGRDLLQEMAEKIDETIALTRKTLNDSVPVDACAS